MTGAHRPSDVDGNGIPRPVVKWFKSSQRPAARCRQCLWTATPADLALCRLHVKTYPDHFVVLHQTTVTEVFAGTRDGRTWVEAVNERA